MSQPATKVPHKLPPRPRIFSFPTSSKPAEKRISHIVRYRDQPKKCPFSLDSYLNSILPLGEVHLLLLLLFRDQRSLVFCEASADGASLLWSEIKGEVFLVLVEDTEL